MSKPFHTPFYDRPQEAGDCTADLDPKPQGTEAQLSFDPRWRDAPVSPLRSAAISMTSSSSSPPGGGGTASRAGHRASGGVPPWEDELLPTKRAASVLGISPRTLERYRHEGVGPVFVRLGGAERPRARIRYRRSDLDAWLSNLKFQSTSEYPR